MRIEEGKTYVDENGKKAGPLVGGSFKYISGRGGADDPEWFNDGTVRIEGEEGYGNLVAEWIEGPIRTETVTVRRLEPGVYGPLNLLSDRSADSFVRLALVRELHNAPELRELARVSLEIAEYLENA